MALQLPILGPVPPGALHYIQNFMLPGTMELTTARLRLRRWQESDLQPFGEMRLDAVGMEFFPSVVSPVASLVSIEQFERRFDDEGYSFWAVESLDGGEFIGCVGLYPRTLPRSLPQVAIGWQLVRRHWGNAYAREAAAAVLEDAFKRLKMKDVIAIIAANNHRSRRVAESLGMVADAKPLIEPCAVPSIDPLSRQLIYRITPSARCKISR